MDASNAAYLRPVVLEGVVGQVSGKHIQKSKHAEVELTFVDARTNISSSSPLATTAFQLPTKTPSRVGSNARSGRMKN